jgi:translocation protein SEC63
LTDETAYDNFKKYGNPDGPGSYNVAIALPHFLLETDNHIPVLLCAFFILLVVIPGFLYLNFGDTSIKDEQGVLLENKRIYGSKLNENLLVKNIPAILAQSIEFQSIGARSKEEIALIKKLKDNEDIDELMPKTQSRNMKSLNIKPLVLILGYLMGDEGVKHPSFKEGLNAILRQGVHHLHMMIELAMQINMDARQGKSVKKLGWKALQSIIEFTQCFVQGLWTSNDPMLQLPGFDQDEIKAYRKKLREH